MMGQGFPRQEIRLQTYLMVNERRVSINSAEITEGSPYDSECRFVGKVPRTELIRAIQDPGQPLDLDMADVAKLREELKRSAEFIESLKAKPLILGSVIRVRDKKVTIQAMGKIVEVNKTCEMKAGQSVRVLPDTMQIMSVVEDDQPAGEILKVARIVRPGLCEITRAGTERTVGYEGKLEEGDRIVLDPTGSVVVENLGKPPDECVLTEPTGISWDDVGGLEIAKRELREAIEGPIKNKAIYEKFGRRPVRGVMLSGPPGCGKTMLGKAAATALAELHGDASKGAFMYVKGPELLNMFVGNTEANIRRIFDNARDHKKKHGFPALIFLDEADAVLGSRGGMDRGGLVGMERTTVPQFLSEMDGLEDSGAIVILATNRPTSLDPAIVRDGRIDRRIRVTRPNKMDSVAILSNALKKAPIHKGAKLKQLATLGASSIFAEHRKLWEGMLKDKREIVLHLSHTVSGAMLVGVADRAVAAAMRRELEGGAEGVSTEDIEAAVDAVFEEAKHVNHSDEIAEMLEAA